jgi:hypothetical protein
MNLPLLRLAGGQCHRDLWNSPKYPIRSSHSPAVACKRPNFLASPSRLTDLATELGAYLLQLALQSLHGRTLRQQAGTFAVSTGISKIVALRGPRFTQIDELGKDQFSSFSTPTDGFDEALPSEGANSIPR